MRIAIGTRFKASDTITLRGGLAYDPTPVRDSNRDPRVPDGDRSWLAIGASIKADDKTNIDIGLARLIVGSQSSNLTVAGSGKLVGTYNNINATAFAVQLNRRF